MTPAAVVSAKHTCADRRGALARGAPVTNTMCKSQQPPPQCDIQHTGACSCGALAAGRLRRRIEGKRGTAYLLPYSAYGVQCKCIFLVALSSSSARTKKPCRVFCIGVSVSSKMLNCRRMCLYAPAHFDARRSSLPCVSHHGET